MHCDVCGVNTFGALDETGHVVKVEFRPHPGGTLHLDGDPRSARSFPRVTRLGPLELTDHTGPLYLDHADSCAAVLEQRVEGRLGAQAERDLVEDLQRGEAARPASRRPRPGEQRGQ